MTFKKINKSGQSIFEYVILTAAIMAVVLFFANTDCFKNTKDSLDNTFDGIVQEILK